MHIECKFSGRHTKTSIEVIIGELNMPYVTHCKYFGFIAQINEEMGMSAIGSK